MNRRFKEFKINELFNVMSGDFHVIGELDKGSVPLISCGETSNGFVGDFDISDDKRYQRAVTVAYNGSPLTSKFHPYEFGTKDDVAVLIPLQTMTDATLLYVTAMLNRMVWRYSYGRKCFKEKLQNVGVLVPVTPGGGIDEVFISELLEKAIKHVRVGFQQTTEKVLEGLGAGGTTVRAPSRR